jgi:hypothetical protein
MRGLFGLVDGHLQVVVFIRPVGRVPLSEVVSVGPEPVGESFLEDGPGHVVHHVLRRLARAFHLADRLLCQNRSRPLLATGSNVTGRGQSQPVAAPDRGGRPKDLGSGPGKSLPQKPRILRRAGTQKDRLGRLLQDGLVREGLVVGLSRDDEHHFRPTPHTDVSLAVLFLMRLLLGAVVPGEQFPKVGDGGGRDVGWGRHFLGRMLEGKRGKLRDG